MAKIDMPTSSLNQTPGQQPKKKLEKVTTGKVTVRQQTDVHTAVWLAKVYAPAVTLGSLSLACMFGSHHTMSRRNASLTAAYIAIDKAFNEYKGRVTERFGDRVQQELERNMKAVPVATKVQNEEGVEETIQEYKDVAMAHTSPYDQLFDETVDTWQPDNRLNRNYLFLMSRCWMWHRCTHTRRSP